MKIDLSGIHGYPVHMRSSCPISCALDVFGDNWSLVVLRDVVLLERRRFSEIAQNEGIATNILSDRLNRLEEKGFIQRVANAQDRRSKLIIPTRKAIDLIPLLTDLMIFGADHCGGKIDSEFLERAKNEREAFMQEFRSRALSELAPAEA